MLLAAALAFAADTTPPPPDPNALPAPPPVEPPRAVYPPGFRPALAHPSADPLMPQSYRTIEAGKYPCSVGIHVDRAGKVTDIDNYACSQDAFWALATAIVGWRFDPATQDGVPVDSVLPYTNVFEVRSWLPRKHVVGFVGGAVSAGGAGWFGAEFRIHLGETLSVTAGIDVDHDQMDDLQSEVWVPTLRADLALSSRRRHFEKRGIYGVTLGGFGDYYGAVGGYFAFRGELMTPVPGLSIGGDAGLAAMFTDALTVDDVGPWDQRSGHNPFFPWLRASLIWYAPVPKDQFIVVAREMDPTVYEPELPKEEPPPALDGEPFPGVPSVHWSEIEPSVGDEPEPGPEFDLYPPGTYRCYVRVLISPDGMPKDIRVAHCPQGGVAAARKAVEQWRWLPRPGKGEVQAVFPAPFFVRHDDAELLPAKDVQLLDGDTAKPLPGRTEPPPVYAHSWVLPEWTNTRPTGSCYVDLDLDEKGTVLKRRWASGDIEVSARVFEALDKTTFYPVVVDGERVRARVRLSMCDT